ncbi:HAD family hydrolase [Deinococcus sp. UYEF24]
MTWTLLLDIDGTLVDSNDAHARAWVTAFRQQGFEIAFEHVRPLIGMGGDQLVPRLTGVRKDDPRFQALSDGWKEAFESEFPSVKPFSGTRELIQKAQDAGWTVVVATSGEADLAERLLQLADVADLLPNRVSSKEVQASKPQPDLMQAALTKAGSAPQDAWMLGDTRFDIEAAHKAGVRCAVVRTGRNSELDSADRIFDTLLDAGQLFEIPATSPA